jgi:hypothetical protein
MGQIFDMRRLHQGCGESLQCEQLYSYRVMMNKFSSFERGRFRGLGVEKKLDQLRQKHERL